LHEDIRELFAADFVRRDGVDLTATRVSERSGDTVEENLRIAERRGNQAS
jgi:hypothetical protein